MKRGFPIYRQLDARDCGAACLRMVAAWHGKLFPLADLRDRAHIDREGVSMEGLTIAAESIGLNALAVQIGLRGEQGLSGAPLPCILHWEQRHFVVLYRIEKDRYYIADPARGKVRLSKDDFLEKWKGRLEEGIVLLLEPGHSFTFQQPPTEQKLGWTYLWTYLKPYKHLLRQLVLGLLVVSVIQLILPFLTKAIVDLGISNRDVGLIWLILIGQLVLVLGQTSTLFFQNWIFLHMGTRFNLSLLSDFLQKLMRLPLGFFDNRLIGDLLNRIQDHRRIELFVTQSSLSLLLSGFQLVIFGLVLLLFNPLIFFIFLLSAALYLTWILLFWNQRALVDADRFEKLSENQQALLELIQGMPEIKLQNSEKKRRWQWGQIQVGLYKVNLRALRINQWQDGGTALVSQVKDVAITLVAAVAVIEGKMTLGSLLAIQFIVGQLNVPLQQIAQFIRRAQDARISWDRFGEIHQLQNEEKDDIPNASFSNIWTSEFSTLEIKDLSFAYHPLSSKVLENLSFQIPKGKVTAIVGSSGSGKTTLLKLILGFYEPTKGQISIDGFDLKSQGKAWWRSICGAVLQDGFIFSDTLANNIAESDSKVNSKKLGQALEVSELKEFVESLPNGVETMIGAQGHGLSQGQRQRVLIARAVYKSPAFLFFDEATNALDAETERGIMQNLNSFFRGRTVVVVAHRLSTVKQADQIVVLEGGRIVEIGNHQELTDRGGRYFELIRNQMI